ncbi:NblA/ycf18 family protein [Laspinema olomoucense]|uniref:NblA/ycf18 family protein n=1 Tax=Laspinema olomoucense TaxID=3231600 RepID=UPI0021BA9AA9|nr:NblA/ycf18 family protein [Laspinema sp. D3d]MCT7971193.1 NblA/ycf18 family protein [Laspinema sp. D3d]
MQFNLEQQFKLRAFETQVEKMSLEQAQFFLNELYKQMIVKDALYHQLLKHEWNIEGITNVNQWKNE